MALVAATWAIVIATGCGKTNTAAAAPPLLEIRVAEVQQKDVPIYTEWIGTLDGFVNADIKAQGAGYLVQRELLSVVQLYKVLGGGWQ